MDSEQIVHQEEQQGTSVGGDSVSFRCLIDEDLSLLTDGHLNLDFLGNNLGFLQIKNQIDIRQNILWSVGQSVQEIGLKISELDLVLVLVVNQLDLLGGEIWSLHLDDDIQELISETGLGDREVNQGHLGLDLWWIMRVGQFCVHEEVEVWGQSKLLVTHLDVLGLTLLDNSPRVHRLNYSINTVLKVFNENWVTLFNSKFNCFDHLRIG